MPLLQVRNFPPDLHNALLERAEQEQRTVSQQTIVLLRAALSSQHDNLSRRRAVLAQIRDNPPKSTADLDVVQGLRQDRER
ncbi:MAG: hypothetical protein FWD29_02425 [Micrococcales bacterium]|nr:hypothetical protein [Micrococcales bacterium]